MLRCLAFVEVTYANASDRLVRVNGMRFKHKDVQDSAVQKTRIQKRKETACSIPTCRARQLWRCGDAFYKGQQAMHMGSAAVVETKDQRIHMHMPAVSESMMTSDQTRCWAHPGIHAFLR